MGLRPFMIGVRCVLLLAVAGWLAISMAARVLADHPPDHRPRDLDGDGIRILLRNPAPEVFGEAEPVDPADWSQVNLTILRPAVLYCPQDPDDGPVCPLLEGARVQVQANNQGGLTISGDSLPTDQVWNVVEARLIPLPDDLGPEYAEDPSLLAPDDIEAPDGAALFAIGERSYRGTLTVRRAAWKRLRVVNALPTVAWLDGVLQAEAAASWPPEALKALAIVCRSTAFVARRDGGQDLDGLRYHLDDHEPVYRGTGSGGERIRAVLVATRGLILTYLGQPFAPPYHLSSGGFLAAAADVFPGGLAADGQRLDDVLPASEDPWCHAGAKALDPAGAWERETVFTGANIKRVTDRNYADKEMGWVYEIEPIGDLLGPDQGLRRVRAVRLKWYHNGSIELPIETFRELLLLDPVHPVHLPSTLWTSDSPVPIDAVNAEGKQERTWRIISYGSGHGVGMSLVSAWHLASQDPPMPAADILGSFYLHAQVDDLHRFLEAGGE